MANPTDLCWASAVDLADMVRAGQVSAVEVLGAILAHVDRINPRLNAVVTRCDESAQRQAEEVDRAVARGESPGPLAGVPISVKDLHCLAGVRTTFGSKLFEHFVPSDDAILVRRLKAAGAVLYGKTNTAEFGILPLACNSIFGDTNNPWDLTRNSGGSSGGSAVAVVCGMGPLATASDGGGSIRIPASFVGAFGVKPHFGRVPHAAFPRGWENLSHQGPISRHVRDAARMLDVMAGPDDGDRWSLPATGESFESACGQPVTGLRLAWCATLGGQPVAPEVREVCQRAALRFEALGCRVDEIDIELEDLGKAQQVIVLCEAAAAYRDRRAEWEQVMFPATRKMLPNADALTFHDLMEAQWARERAWATLAPVFDRYAALLTPTAPITAPLNGTLGPKQIDGQAVRTLSWLGHCVPFNMTWQPAATIPAGFDGAGLPVGLQIVGRRFDESMLFRLASAYEAAHPWTNIRPPVCANV